MQRNTVIINLYSSVSTSNVIAVFRSTLAWQQLMDNLNNEKGRKTELRHSHSGRAAVKASERDKRRMEAGKGSVD